MTKGLDGGSKLIERYAFIRVGYIIAFLEHSHRARGEMMSCIPPHFYRQQ